MDESLDASIQNLSESNVDRRDTPGSTFSRRDLFRLTLGGGSGLALGGLLDVPAMRAATGDLKLSDVSEFTTSCNFCSCGCGMIAAVRDGKLLTMEGDYDHIVNRGALCVKGISMHATHASPNRLTTPRYRAPGSDHWEDISWEDAITRVAQKVRKTRDATWIATEKVASSIPAVCRRGIAILMTRTIAFLLTAVLIQPAAAKAGPWKSLFDGKSMNAWRIFKTDNAPKMCDTRRERLLGDR